MPDEFQKTALITGASRGIGATIALTLAEAGMNIAINYVGDANKADAEELAETLTRDYGVAAEIFACDVSDFDAVKEMAKAVKDSFGRIDVLVNNAGITKDGLLMRMKEEQFKSVIDVNLIGTFNCMRHVAPIMIKQRYGHIVNIASIVGIYGNAGQVNYSASKAGIIGMTKSAAKELGSRNITVNAVAPGFIETQMTASLGDEAHEALEKNIALGRLGSTQDVANAVAFLASDSAAYISGQVLGIDGGMSL